MKIKSKTIRNFSCHEFQPQENSTNLNKTMQSPLFTSTAMTRNLITWFPENSGSLFKKPICWCQLDSRTSELTAHELVYESLKFRHFHFINCKSYVICKYVSRHISRVYIFLEMECNEMPLSPSNHCHNYLWYMPGSVCLHCEGNVSLRGKKFMFCLTSWLDSVVCLCEQRWVLTLRFITRHYLVW